MSSTATTSTSAATLGNSIVGKNQDATCYVGNLEERATDSVIWELFLQVAPVVSLHIPRDRLNQTHYGYGFVELQSEADADYASKILHGVKLYGKPLRVNKASSDRRNLDVGANLFVGNLDPMVDDSTLMDTFKAFGNVISAKVAREGEGGVGPSRGFGFVSFDSFDAADVAIESMSGQFLCNRPITLSYAFKKDGKSERHGSAAERLLAAQAKKTMAPVVQNAMPAAGGYRPSAYPGYPVQAQGIPQGSPQGFAPPGYDPNFAAAMLMMQQQQGQQVQGQQQQVPPEYYAQYMQQHYAQYMQQQQQYPPQ